MRRFKKNTKLAALTVTMFGMLYTSACTLGDLRLNVVSGSLAFVKSYTTDIWEALFPAPEDVLGQ